MSQVDDPNRLVEILDHLETENACLRVRILDILRWMEEAVSDQVACERHLAECDRNLADVDTQRGTLAAELAAVQQSRAEIDAQRCSLEAELSATQQSRAEIDVHRRSLETELGAIHQSRSWRAMIPLRKVYARTRSMGARR